MTIIVTGKNNYYIFFEGYSHRLSRFNNICIKDTLLVQFVMQKLKENQCNVTIKGAILVQF